MELLKGANAPLASNNLNLVLSWAGQLDVDVSVLLTGPTGKVGSDDDFIFYNQPRHHTGAVTHRGKVVSAVRSDTVTINLASVPQDVERVVVAASVGSGNFGQLSDVSLAVIDADTQGLMMRFTMASATVETAMIAGEVYRRDGVWKFRAIGQGYASGLKGVASDYGITVETDELIPETNLEKTAAGRAPLRYFVGTDSTQATSLDLRGERRNCMSTLFQIENLTVTDRYIVRTRESGVEWIPLSAINLIDASTSITNDGLSRFATVHFGGFKIVLYVPKDDFDDFIRAITS